MHQPLVLDCTIRDGGYQNNWLFKDDMVIDICKSLKESKVDYIEIGFINRPEIYNNKLCGKWRYLNEEILRKVIDQNNVPKIAVMADFNNSDISLFLPSKDSIIDLVRVAFHKNDMEKALIFCKELKDLGYKVAANAMATMYYNQDELVRLSNLAVEYNIDYLYIADSYGCLTMDNIDNLVHIIRPIIGDKVSLGFHAHNNMQNAFGNFAYSLKCGYFDIIDSTLGGMGRGAGNLCTELVLSHLHKPLLPVLVVVDKYFISSKKDGWEYKTTSHGTKFYSLPQLIGGHFGAHPNYAIKLAIDYNISDITKLWNIYQEISKGDEKKLFNLKYLNNLVISYSD